MAIVSWAQTALDLGIDLTVHDEDTKKLLKSGTAAAALATSAAVLDGASAAKAGAQLASTALKEGLHAAGVDSAKLDQGIDLGCQVGAGLAASPKPLADAVGEEALGLGAGAAAGLAGSAATDGEFSVMDGMSMGRGLGQGTFRDGQLQADQLGLRATELGVAGGAAVVAATALDEDPAQAAKLGAQLGLTGARGGRQLLNGLQARNQADALAQKDAADASSTDKKSAGSGATDKEAAGSGATDTDDDPQAKLRADADAQLAGAARDAISLGLQLGAGAALAAWGPEVGTLSSLQAGQSLGATAAGAYFGLSAATRPATAPDKNKDAETAKSKDAETAKNTDTETAKNTDT